MRRPRILALVPVAVLVLLACLAGCGLTGSGGNAVPPPSHNVGTRMDGTIPKSILDIPLTDSSGRTRHLSDFAGKLVVISDSMTLCQESCPLDTATLVQTARNTDAAGAGKDVEFLTITVDPVRDTVPQMAAYRKLYHGPSNWLALTGTPRDVHRLWKYFGVYIKKVPADKPPPHNWRTHKVLTYDIEHSDETFFLDRHGRERFILEGMPHVAHRSEIPTRIYRFLSDEGRENVSDPKPTAWTEKQALEVLGWLLDKRIGQST